MGVTSEESRVPMNCARCDGPALRVDQLVRMGEPDSEPLLDRNGRYCVNGCHL